MLVVITMATDLKYISFDISLHAHCIIITVLIADTKNNCIFIINVLKSQKYKLYILKAKTYRHVLNRALGAINLVL